MKLRDRLRRIPRERQPDLAERYARIRVGDHVLVVLQLGSRGQPQYSAYRRSGRVTQDPNGWLFVDGHCIGIGTDRPSVYLWAIERHDQYADHPAYRDEWRP